MGNKQWIWILVVAILLIVAFLLGQKSGSDSPTSTDEQVVIVPDGWRRLDDYTIVIDAGILPGELVAVWVEYGLAADNLSESTPRMVEELGMGTRGEYGSYSVVIPHPELEPGRSYFYRLLAETERGDILQTGINRFTAGK